MVLGSSVLFVFDQLSLRQQMGMDRRREKKSSLMVAKEAWIPEDSGNGKISLCGDCRDSPFVVWP